jgi:hypothetical protein
VQDYIHAQRFLQQYGNMASFQGIQGECEAIVKELRQRLRDQFKSKEVALKFCYNEIDSVVYYNLMFHHTALPLDRIVSH